MRILKDQLKRNKLLIKYKISLGISLITMRIKKIIAKNVLKIYKF